MSRKRMTRRSFITASALTGLAMSLNPGGLQAATDGPNPKSQRDCPVVVIGAGLGGLCCGTLLARQGFPVTVLEQHGIPGGYATSFERAGGKFNFDVSLHRLVLSSDTARVLCELGIANKLDLVKISNSARIITSDDDRRVPTSPVQALDYLLRKYPEEKEGIHGYLQECRAVLEELAALKTKGGSGDLPTRYPRLWNIRDKTLAAFVDGFVRDPRLKEALTLGWESYGLPPSRLSAFLYVVANASKLDGQFYVKNRSQDLSDALAESIEKAGGRVVCDTMVERITLKNQAVTGVETAEGGPLPAKVIVSNASALTTFDRMLPARTLPASYLQKVKGFKPSVSTFIIWLGLNRDVRRTIKEPRIILTSGRGGEADFVSCLAGEVEKLPLSVVIYDNYYQGYSHPGTSTLTAATMSGYQPWRRFETDYRAGRKAAYHAEKQRWADVLVRKLEEKAIPGLSEMVEVREAATPLTNWRYTRNPEGAIYGFEQSVENSFMTRLKNRTPVKGLYLASAWGSPGGGYAGVLRGGYNAFSQIMEDWAG